MHFFQKKKTKKKKIVGGLCYIIKWVNRFIHSRNFLICLKMFIMERNADEIKAVGT